MSDGKPTNYFKNVEIFDGKTVDELLEEIYNRSSEKQQQILNLIQQVSPMINNASDASILAPLISEYMDVSVKNDEQLIKLAAVVQRWVKSIEKTSGSSNEERAAGYEISKEELQEVLQNVSQRKELN